MTTELQSWNRSTKLHSHRAVGKSPSSKRVRSRLAKLRRGGVKGVIVALLALTAVGAGGYYWWSLRRESALSSSEKPVLDTVTRGPFDHIVLEQGEIESSSNNEVKCEVKGNGGSGTPILNVIPEGTFVKKGDLLCELDASALETEAKNQRIVVSTAEATVISSEAAVSKAEISRQEYLEGTYLTERSLILSEIAVAQQELRKAELSLQSAERLAAKGTLKPLQIEAEQFSVQNARSSLESAQGRLRVLDELTKAKMLVQLDSDIATAKAKLDSDQNTLAEEKSKLAEIEAQILACQVRAPMDGQVVYANKQGNRGGADFVVEPGSVVREQQTIFLLPDPTRMQVRAKVNESRITLIREGMRVKIRVGAVDGELSGAVVKVNKYAEPGNWWGSNVKEYAVIVQISDPPETIRTGMTAEVRIFVEQLQEATQIPILAVYESKRHYFVLIQKGEKYETKEIKVQAANEKYVTISEGDVNVGDRVVLNPRNHLSKMNLPELKDELGPDGSPEMNSDGTSDGVNSLASGDASRGSLAAGKPAATETPTGSERPQSGGNPADMFKRLDSNSDGKLDKDEASTIPPLASGFEAADTNKNGTLEVAELTAAMSKMRSRAEGPGGPGSAGAPGGTGGLGGSGTGAGGQ